MTMISHSDKSGTVKIAVTVIVLVLIMFSLGYFFVWRPSDVDIQTAQSNVSALQKSVTVTIPSVLKDLSKPSLITPEMAVQFKFGVDTYTKALVSLEKSAAIQRSSSTAFIYSKYKPGLTRYGQLLASLSTSVSTYGNILSVCNSMVTKLPEMNSKNDFDKASAACDKAVSDTGSSLDETFNKQFFNNYQQKAKASLLAIGQYFVATDSKDADKTADAKQAVADAKQALVEPLSVTINYEYTPPSSEAFTKLTAALNSLKNSLIR